MKASKKNSKISKFVFCDAGDEKVTRAVLILTGFKTPEELIALGIWIAPIPKQE